jgi:hypothetical protein
MAATTGHSINTGQYGDNAEIYSSLKLLHWLNLNIRTKNVKFVEDHPMNIHVQFGFNHICSFWEEGIWTFSHRVQC